MKNIRNIIMLATAALAFASCSMTAEKTQIADDSAFKSPVLGSVSDVIVNSDNAKVESVVFEWTPASFGADVEVDYKLYFTNGDLTALAGQTYKTTYAITKNDLNGLVCNDLKVAANTKAEIGAYVVACVKGADEYEAKSSSIAFNVNTFKAALRWLFLPGNYQSWTIDAAPQFWETEGGTNIYKILVDLNDGSADYSYFKVTVARNWSDENWGYNFLTPDWTCPEQGDSNLSIPVKEGTINVLTVNRGKMTISREPVSKVGLIGAFDECGWSEDKELDFTYDAVNNIWVSPAVTFSGQTNFLVRLNKSWDHKYGTGSGNSDDVEGGVLLEKGAGDLNVPEAGTYVMKLHGNRTPYVLVMEKQ